MKQHYYLVLIMALFLPSQLLSQSCVEFDEDDFSSGDICATEANPTAGSATTNAIDIWDAVCGSSANSDFEGTLDEDCTCSGGYVVVTMDFLNSFNSQAGLFNLPWSSMNGSSEGYEFGIGFVSAATTSGGAPIAGLNVPASVTAAIPTYCNPDYAAGTTMSAHILGSAIGVLDTFADDLNATSNICASSGQGGEDTGSGSGPNTNNSGGAGVLGLASTDLISQVTFIYGVNNTPGTDCDGDGNTGVDTSPSASIGGIEVCPLDISLPVELSSFEGSVGSSGNALSWTTLSESNTSHFSLERSEGNEAPFTEIALVNAAGFSQTEISYQFIDNDPPGKASYRLRMVDFDGGYEYSANIELLRDLSFGLKSIYPSITSSSATAVVENSNDESLTISIFDTFGRLVSQKPEDLSSGVHKLRLNLEGQSAGVYFVEISNGKQSETGRVLKQ